MAGDKLRINVENLVRFAPLVAPTLERMHVTNHFFFVPYRLVWPNFTKFLVGEDHEHPYYVPNGTGKATIAGYLGYPIETYNVPREMNPMFLAAYYLIYDEYYRDQNLQIPSLFPLLMGIISTTSNLLDKSHSDVPGSMITSLLAYPFLKKVRT